MFKNSNYPAIGRYTQYPYQFVPPWFHGLFTWPINFTTCPIIYKKNQNTWEMTRILNSKMFKNRFQLFVNWVKNRFDWQTFENVTGAPDVLDQYFNK